MFLVFASSFVLCYLVCIVHFHLFIIVLMCVVYMHMRVVPEEDAGSLLRHSLPYSSETGSFAGPGARLAVTKPQSPFYFTSCSAEVTGTRLHTVIFYRGARDLNSDPHA